MTDSIARQQFPVPLNYRKADRDQIRAMLITRLSELIGDGVQPASTALSDPTIAVLDAWATVADIVDFYQERLAAENYLTTATEPFSISALAKLLGYRPRPGLAATCLLAYTLAADPTDTAVLITASQQVQSVPAAGEKPQTFETTANLVARPSWNTLTVKKTAPFQVNVDDNQAPAGDSPPQLKALPSAMVVTGTTTGLSPNDFIFIHVSKNDKRVPLKLATVTPDLRASTTSFTFVGAPQDSPSTPADAASLVNDVATMVTKPPASDGAPAPQNPQRAQIDPSVVALKSAEDPMLARSLYPALASTTVGVADVDGIEALRVTTAPFGVQLAPQVRFDSRGRQQVPQEWPIDGSLKIRLVTDGDGVPSGAQIEGPKGSGVVSFADKAAAANPVAGLTVSRTQPKNGWTVTFTPDGADSAIVDTITIDLGTTDSDTVTVTRGSTPANPARPTSVGLSLSAAKAAASSDNLAAPSGERGGLYVTLEYLAVTELERAVEESEGLDLNLEYVIDVTDALPVSNPCELDLREPHSEVLAHSYIMVSSASGPDDAGDGVIDRRVLQVTDVTPLTVSKYGISMATTRLTLASPWIGTDARLLSDARLVTVYAKAEPLDLLPAPFTDDVWGTTIDVEGLHPGIDIGRVLILTGDRADVGTATVNDGEAIAIGAIALTTEAGSTPFTTLTLTKPLSRSYRRDTVTLYGNVVQSHHGQTFAETPSLKGDPNHLRATLGRSPVLADPTGGKNGYQSSLTLVVDGRTWAPVSRLDSQTPPRSYLTEADTAGNVTITLGEPLPHPASTVRATYRVGEGAKGNAAAGQLKLLMSQPLAVSAVVNPLPASGGADPDGPEVIRANASLGLGALGRVVSVQDVIDLAASWAGIGKVTATLSGNELTAVVAGTDPTALDPSSALVQDLGAALTAAGDITVPITVVPAKISRISLSAQVNHDPDLAWDTVRDGIRAELLDANSYGHRGIGQSIVLSDLLSVIHRVDGVRSAVILQLLPDATATASSDTVPPVVPIAADTVAYLDPNIGATLTLQEVTW